MSPIWSLPTATPSILNSTFRNVGLEDQADLGEQLCVHQKQVSAYDWGVSLPPTEVLIKLAKVFNVTLDYLAFEAKEQPASLNIQNRELLRRFEEGAKRGTPWRIRRRTWPKRFWTG